MTFNELLPLLRRFPRVLVTGPQRSGTTIACKMVAKELGYTTVLEETFREEDLLRFVSCINANSQVVIQAPALSSVAHLLRSGGVAVVFMIRATAAIQRSEQRIDWRREHEALEKAKYFHPSSELPISVLKETFWRAVQKPILGEAAFELDYESLRQHFLWVPQEKRLNFGPRQTEEEMLQPPVPESADAGA